MIEEKEIMKFLCSSHALSENFSHNSRTVCIFLVGGENIHWIGVSFGSRKMAQ